MKRICACLFVSVAVALAPAISSADVFVPGQSVPGTSSDIFTWAGSQPGSTFAFWETFDGFATGGFPVITPGTSPSANSSFADGGTTSQLTFQSFANLLSSGNAYGGNFGPDDPAFQTTAFATVESGTSGGAFTRIVAQFETLGSELDYSSILLSPSAGTAGTIAPSFAVATSSTTGTQGQNVSYLALWDIAASQEEYRVDFMASATHMSLDSFRVDSFTQSSAFLTPTAVPEPNSLALLGLVTGGAALVRRRRTKSAA